MKTPTPSPESWPTLQRADAECVLRRAIEIEEQRGEWIEGVELRRIAVDAGIDPRSVALALAELPVPACAPRPPSSVHRGGWTPPAIVETSRGQLALDVVMLASVLCALGGLMGALAAAATCWVGFLVSPIQPLAYALLAAGALGAGCVVGITGRRAE